MTDKEQIQEMARNICSEYDCVIPCQSCAYYGYADLTSLQSAEKLYSKGYRKVERGEWKRIEINGKHYGQIYYQHSDCPINQTQMFPSPYNSCPNCGADMRKGR